LERAESLADIGFDISDAVIAIEESKGRFTAEMTVFGKRASFHAETHLADSVSVAVDATFSKVQRQVRRHKDRIQDSRRRPRAPRVAEDLPDLPDIPGEGEEAPLEIVPAPNLFYAKPMSVEEAALQLDMSDDDFITFRNAKTDDVNVVFKHGADTVGWIHP
jgi:putative sigma-54 modulation protein